VSQSLLVITDPFASIILSIWLFGERFTNSPAKTTIAMLAFTVMAAGLTVLTRTAPQDVLIPVAVVGRGAYALAALAPVRAGGADVPAPVKAAHSLIGP
jgi:ABC-type branched-subunit amino acid transport system permease subunit